MSAPTGMGRRTAAHYRDIDVRLHKYINQQSGNVLFPAHQNFRHFHPAPGIVHKPHYARREHRHYGIYSYDDGDDDERMFRRHWMHY